MIAGSMNQHSMTAPESGASSQQASRVLVVEDDVLVRMGAAQYLRGCGFTVLEAVDVDEALDILAADTLVRVVFSDVKMPGARDGLDLAHAILSDHPNVRVLLTSGVSPSPGTIPDVTLLKKPYFLYDVEQRVRSLMAQSESRAAR
jgi:CheY-like chemotaxis protein